MAWPGTSFYQAFTSNVTTITKAFLDAIQQGVNDLWGGGYSFKKVHISGTAGGSTSAADGALKVANGVTVDSGGVVVTAGSVVVSSGQVTASGAITTSTGDVTATTGKINAGLVRANATAGSGQSVAAGTLYKDLIPIAMGRIAADGSITKSAGISSIAHTGGSGNYTITTTATATTALLVLSNLTITYGSTSTFTASTGGGDSPWEFVAYAL